MFVVCVTFTAAADRFATLLPLIRQQAATSLGTEPECHRFDVCVGAEDEVFLYELYTDEAAFQAHLETAHFLAFDRETRDLVKTKTVRTYKLTDTGGKSS